MNLFAGYLFLTMLDVAVPYLIVKHYVRKTLNSDLPKEEKIYRGTKSILTGILLSVALFLSPIISLGYFQQIMEVVSEHITSVFIGSLVFMSFLILPIMVSIVLVILTASRIEVEVKEIDVKMGRIAKDVIKLFAFILMPGILWLGIYVTLPDSIRGNMPAMFCIFAVYILALFAFAPYLSRVFSKPRPTPESLRSKLLKFCENPGFKVRDIRITGKKEYKVANAGVTGILPGFRYIFVTKYMLETFEPEEIRAVIAHEIGHIMGRYLFINVLVAIGWFLFWTGIAVGLAKFGVNIISPTVFTVVYAIAYVTYFIL
ncbi:M48 family metalloprotease [Thermococcus sp.]